TDGWGELDGPPGFIAAKLSPEERRERERELLQASIKAEQDGVVLTIPSETKEQGIIRIVLGELTEQESNEWIARFSNRLRVPCGKLGVSIYGYILCEGGESDCFDKSFGHYRVQYVDIPPGDYLAEVMVYLPSSTALHHLYNAANKRHPDRQEQAESFEPEDESLEYSNPHLGWSFATYFRRTRPNVIL